MFAYPAEIPYYFDMKQFQLNNLLDELSQPLFGFSYALCGDREEAQKLIVDAYTVYIVREKRFISGKELDSQNLKERRDFKKYLYKELLGEILELALKRLTGHRVDTEVEEHKCFFTMGIFSRAVFYLKEMKGFTIEDIQEVFGLERHRALEFYYNARQAMVGDIESLYRGGTHAN